MSEYAPPTVTSRNAFGADYPDCDEILDVLGGEKGVGIATAMRQRLTSRPYTLVHGDLRCDNVFKPKKYVNCTIGSNYALMQPKS